jgi:molybdopterin converting factor small subunit
LLTLNCLKTPEAITMTIHVTFYSYFKDLTGCPDTTVELPPDSTIGALHELLMRQFPKLTDMKKSTLIAVDVEYQNHQYKLKDQDSVSLFPPVQGG